MRVNPSQADISDSITLSAGCKPLRTSMVFTEARRDKSVEEAVPGVTAVPISIPMEK